MCINFKKVKLNNSVNTTKMIYHFYLKKTDKPISQFSFYQKKIYLKHEKLYNRKTLITLDLLNKGINQVKLNVEKFHSIYLKSLNLNSSEICINWEIFQKQQDWVQKKIFKDIITNIELDSEYTIKKYLLEMKKQNPVFSHERKLLLLLKQEVFKNFLLNYKNSSYKFFFEKKKKN